jgi:hypothetical protein
MIPNSVASRSAPDCGTISNSPSALKNTRCIELSAA